MATKWTHWLNEHEALVDYGQQAPSPSKDFFHIFVTPNEFIYRLWKIVPPTRSDYQNNPPSEVRNSWEDFPLDDRLHSELQRVGGSKTLDYLLNLANGHLDYLPRLPRNVLIQIIMMLDLEDIKALSLVSHFFKELCNCNELWEKIYRQNSETPITDELQSLAREHGWKDLFFTNKLQLQKHLRRQAERQAPANQAFLTQPME
ncbi:F-box only protein 36-like [Haliotis rubra]|uniref:F-box only protein 36-like n=1 Tax=Haliotis rubra TaxID=36100 RepID=UPI001EE60C1D|nr:F-box only protein 36-like [Haliotis rubra]